MTEQEWFQSSDPVAMLAFLNRPQSDRLLLLYGVACCRVHWALLPHHASREAVEWTEKFADDRVEMDEEFGRIDWYSEGAAFAAEHDARRELGVERLEEVPLKVQVPYLANSLMTLDSHRPYDPTLSANRKALSVPMIYEIFGNPFRRIAILPQWLTDNVVGLAQTIYDDRCFEHLPILADALMDASCFDDSILNHCRSEEPLVRGCWVVDLILGKTGASLLNWLTPVLHLQSRDRK